MDERLQKLIFECAAKEKTDFEFGVAIYNHYNPPSERKEFYEFLDEIAEKKYTSGDLKEWNWNKLTIKQKTGQRNSIKELYRFGELPSSVQEKLNAEFHSNLTVQKNISRYYRMWRADQFIEELSDTKVETPQMDVEIERFVDILIDLNQTLQRMKKEGVDFKENYFDKDDVLDWGKLSVKSVEYLAYEYFGIVYERARKIPPKNAEVIIKLLKKFKGEEWIIWPNPGRKADRTPLLDVLARELGYDISKPGWPKISEV